MAWELYAEYLQGVQKDTLDFSKGLVEGQDEFREQLITCMSGRVNETQLLSDIEDKSILLKKYMDEIKSLKSDRSFILIVTGIIILVLIGCLLWMFNHGFMEKDEVSY